MRGLAVGLGLVALGAVLDLWTAIRPGLGPVEPEILAEAATAIEAAKEPGSRVVHSPLFGVRALKGLGSLRARPDWPTEESRRRRPVWLIDRAGAPMGGLPTPTSAERLGPGVVLKRFAPLEPGAGRVVLDLVELSGVSGRIVSRRGVKPCRQPRAEGGVACAGAPEWMYIAPKLISIDGERWRCVWAHPPAQGALELELPVTGTVAAGRRLELELRSALSDEAVRLTSDGAAVRTVVRQGGRELGRLVRSNRVGWAERRFVLEPGVPVVLAVSAAKDGRRHHCLDARIVDVEDGR